jgi:hypothetical protein
MPMAHKKVHPAESKAPPTDHDHSLNPPGPKSQNSAGAPDSEHDPQNRTGAFVGKGEHARQQQMGNKD